MSSNSTTAILVLLSLLIPFYLCASALKKDPHITAVVQRPNLGKQTSRIASFGKVPSSKGKTEASSRPRLLGMLKADNQSAEEIFPVCDNSYALSRVREIYNKCSECVRAIILEDITGKPGKEACPPGCCAQYTSKSVNTRHEVVCYNGCCIRLIQLRAFNGITAGQLKLIIRLSTIVNNEQTFLGSTGIGRCSLKSSKKLECGPRCADQYNDANQCQGRRTIHVPRYGNDMKKGPYTASFPDGSDTESESTFDTENSSTSGGSIKSSASCFPAAATVQVQDGSVIRLDQLRVGDRVLAAPNKYSKVFAFTHAIAGGIHIFTRLTMKSGDVLTVTDGHYVYSDDVLVQAGHISEGDMMRLANGEKTRVVKGERFSDFGLYNPQTLHGDIVVNGILSSTYTEAVKPYIAHPLLAPVRVLSSWIDVGQAVLLLSRLFHDH